MCQNNGTCIDLHNRYICECTDGYYGRECQNQVSDEIQPSVTGCQQQQTVTITQPQTVVQPNTVTAVCPQETVTAQCPTLVQTEHASSCSTVQATVVQTVELVNTAECQQSIVTEISTVFHSSCPVVQATVTVTESQTAVPPLVTVECPQPTVTITSCPQSTTTDIQMSTVVQVSTVTEISTLVQMESVSPCPTTDAIQPTTPESCPTAEPCPTLEPDIDYCAGDPCQNGGTCFNGTSNYLCVCTAGWNDTSCQTGKLCRNLLTKLSNISGLYQFLFPFLERSQLSICTRHNGNRQASTQDFL